MKKLSFLFILFFLAFSERVLFDFGPNIELVTMALVISSFYFGWKESFWLIFTIMLFSDLIIGNTNIFIFTWTGFLLPAFVIQYFSIPKSSSRTKATTGTIAGILANGFFFIWTNFGVWLLSGMYAKTAAGLLESYINALPFLRMQLISTFIFVPLGFVLTELIISLNKKYQMENKLNYILSSRSKVIS